MTRAEKAAFWRRHVESLQQSGLSIRAYAERAGVAVSGLKYWRKHMSQARRGNAPLMLRCVSRQLPPKLCTLAFFG